MAEPATAPASVTKLEPPKQPAKIPISLHLGDRIIDGALIKPITFTTYMGFISDAQAMTQPADWQARVKRVRMVKQVTYFMGPAPITLSSQEVLQLPIRDTLKIQALLDVDEGKLGKIVREGDGIEKAIVYELGTPVTMRSGKEPVVIRELEFFAKTYGDIEDVLAAPTLFHQGLVLLSTVAKPLRARYSRAPLRSNSTTLCVRSTLSM